MTDLPPLPGYGWNPDPPRNKPRTYGDILPALMDYHAKQIKSESWVAAARRAQRYANAEYRAVLDRAAYECPKKGTDPMSPININITIAEIENGVIVTTDRSEGYGPGSPLGRGSYYQDLETAIDSMEDIIGKAWDQAKEQQRRYVDEMVSAVAAKQAEGRPFVYPHDQPDSTVDFRPLPEEAAAGAEPIPVVDENERDSAFLRTDPVMDTSGFNQKVDTSQPSGDE